jgi:hypothetical protein
MAFRDVCLTNGQKDPDLGSQRSMFLLTCFLNAMHFGNFTGILWHKLVLRGWRYHFG